MCETLQKMWDASAMVDQVHLVYVYLEKQLKSSAVQCKNMFCMNNPFHLSSVLLQKPFLFSFVISFVIFLLHEMAIFPNERKQNDLPGLSTVEGSLLNSE